jgi:hypothetical protein
LGLKAYSAKLDIPDAPETKIFRAVEQVLRDDVKLAAVIRTWATWRGEDVDLIDFPSSVQCPFLRISPLPTASDRETEIQHKMPITIRLFLAVVGTNVDNIINFCGAVRHAIFPQNNIPLRDQVRSAIMLAGASIPVIRLNAYGMTTDEQGVPVMGAEGSIEFNTLIGT